MLKKINILGNTYKIEYMDNPSEVDIFKRDSLWGQIDFWTRTIRVYKKDRTKEDIFETIIHEVIHGIAESLKLKSLTKKENHDDLSLLAIGLADTLTRNKIVSL